MAIVDLRPERERALTVLEQIRTALTNDNLQDAVKQIDMLQDLLADWKRTEARQWLDEAMRGDLLVFNIEAATQRLAQWRSTLPEDQASVGEEREFTHYKERVQERSRQKQSDLQARGVIAHCEELWRKAAELERSEQPAHPDHLMNNYYTRARDVAASAYAESPNNATLDTLVQQTDRLWSNKLIAGNAYKKAIEKEKYIDALTDLDKLPPGDLVPRFRVVMDPTSREMTSFDRMIAITDAHDEIERLARLWAADRAATVIKSGTEALQTYSPQAALDALIGREQYERFLREEFRQQMRDLERRANEDVRLLEQAERRARQAQRLTEENAIGAWNIYVEAYQTYAGAPALVPARETIINGMISELEGLAGQAEQAFMNKQMERVGQIYQDTRLKYSEKDALLDTLLARLEEINWQAQTYQEYLLSANEMLDQIQELIWQDVVQAGEILGQLENYPPIVLEEMQSLPSIRSEVRRRLNAEVMYNQLFKLLLSTNPAEIERGISVATEQRDESRFRQLRSDLEIHLRYLEARRDYAAGDVQKAKAKLESVAVTAAHPDQAVARDLMDEINSAAEQQ